MKNKKFLLAIIICLLLIIFGLVACGNTAVDISKEKYDNPMFTEIAHDPDFYIIYDNETKVMYAVSDGGYNSGNFTMLVNADGSPKLYKGE